MNFTRIQLLMELTKIEALPTEAKKEVALYVKRKLMEEPPERIHPRTATEVSRTALDREDAML